MTTESQCAQPAPRPFTAVKAFADSVLAMLDERIKAIDQAAHPFNDYFGDQPETIVAAKAQAGELREVRTQVRILGDRALVELMKFKPAIPAPDPEQENPMPPDLSKLEAEMAQAAEREHWREINALADKADEAEFTENDPLVRRLRGRADFLRNKGEVKTPELLEAAAKELETPAPEGAPLTLPPPDTHCWDDDTGKDVWSYSADLVRSIVSAALAAPAPQAPAEIEAKADNDSAYAYADGWNACRRAMLAAAPAPTDAELERRTGEPHVDGWPLVSGLPVPKAPEALTVDAITRCWGQSEGTRNGYAPFARAVIAEFCRINNITAPKEPTNDR